MLPLRAGSILAQWQQCVVELEEVENNTNMRMKVKHDKFVEMVKREGFANAQAFRVNAACTPASPANNYT